MDQLARFVNLSHIHIAKSHDITTLPILPVTLAKLVIKDCAGLSKMEESMSQCGDTLKTLWITKCPRLSLFAVFRHCVGLKCLQRLKLSDLSSLSDSNAKPILSLPSTLHRLTVISSCYWDVKASLSRVSDIKRLVIKFTESLNTSPIHDISDPEWDITDVVERFKEIRVLSLHGYYIVLSKLRPGMSHFRKARVVETGTSLNSTDLTVSDLQLHRIKRLQVALGFGALVIRNHRDGVIESHGAAILDTLILRCIQKVTIRLYHSKAFENLTCLEMYHCDRIGDIIEQCPRITNLKLDSCSLESLMIPATVKNLVLHNNMNLHCIDFTECNKSIENVDIICCPRLHEFVSIEGSTVKDLRIETCFKLSHISWIRSLESLETCTLGHLPNARLHVGMFSDQENLRLLKIISLDTNNMWCMARNAALSFVQFNSSSRVLDVGAIVTCPDIYELRIKCKRAINMHVIGYMSNLRMLSITAYEVDHDMIQYLKTRLPETFIYVVNLSDAHVSSSIE